MAIHLDEVTGPVDYLVLRLPTDRQDGSVAQALADLVDSGLIMLLDVMVVQKDRAGVVSGLELNAVDGALRMFAGARSGLLGDDELADAGSVLDPGTTGAVLLYENSWARPFVAAARSQGAEVVASARISADVLMDALVVLD
ncbi:MAG TPA: DUF6325 family protein [Microthrixaceae bacterium]|nr:DUF6325 family protein [Microthrixaceae bacterium]